MATGQTILDTMEVLLPELQLQSGESDVTKGLIALNRAQDLLEAHLAQFQDIMAGSSNVPGTVTTTALQEYTTFPSGLLRLDGLDFIDPATSLPLYPLDPLDDRGGHAFYSNWPWNLYIVSQHGRPEAYWTNGTRIYWSPVPEATHTVRYYGLVSAADITASGTFTYADYCILPLASVAVNIIRIGLDDPNQQIQALATEAFNSVIDAATGYRRDGPTSYRYTKGHSC